MRSFAALRMTIIFLCGLTLSGHLWAAEAKTIKVRVGHFPNVTHAQAVIAHANHAFEEKLARQAIVEWKVFNAGPSAIEALFAGRLDIVTIGPSPAINAYVKSQGSAVRLVAGSAIGGAALIVRGDLQIKTPEDFQNKKIASPQLGNSQDVSLRSWLAGSGLKLKEVGGSVEVLPLSNADQQTLFLKKEIDAAWTVEPWVSMLVEKSGGKIYLNEADLWAQGKYATAVVLVRKKFLEEHPEVVKKYLETHLELTDWIQKNSEEAKKILKAEIEKETGKEMPGSILDSAFKRVTFSCEALQGSMTEQAKSAFRAGFLKKEPDLSGLFDLKLLEEVLGAKKLDLK